MKLIIEIDADAIDAELAQVTELLQRLNGSEPSPEPSTPAPAPKASTRKVTSVKAKPVPAVEEPDPDDDEDMGLDDDDDVEDGPTLQDAVDRAKALVGAGKSQKVRETLSAYKIKRVTDLKPDQIAEFVDALGS
jgi:hypothetical protein